MVSCELDTFKLCQSPPPPLPPLNVDWIGNKWMRIPTYIWMLLEKLSISQGHASFPHAYIAIPCPPILHLPMDALACGPPPPTHPPCVGAGTGPTHHYTSLNEADSKLKPHWSMVIWLYLDAQLGSLIRLPWLWTNGKVFEFSLLVHVKVSAACDQWYFIFLQTWSIPCDWFIVENFILLITFHAPCHHFEMGNVGMRYLWRMFGGDVIQIRRWIIVMPIAFHVCSWLPTRK